MYVAGLPLRTSRHARLCAPHVRAALVLHLAVHLHLALPPAACCAIAPLLCHGAEAHACCAAFVPLAPWAGGAQDEEAELINDDDDDDDNF